MPPRTLPPLVLALHDHAAELAERIADTIGGQPCIAPQHPAQAMRDAFATGQPLICICAAGIIIRALAPLLANKRSEPPVIAISADGAHIVPLLGGHAGGNALARRIAEALKAHAAITTASDTSFGLALDEPPPGWRLANPQDAKPFITALLDGAKVHLVDDTGHAGWLRESALPFSESPEDAALRITCTTHRLAGHERHLVYHPRQLVLGIGLARNAPVEAVQALVQQALTEADAAEHAIAAIGTLACKADEPALAALCAELDVPLHLFSAAQLQAIDVPNPSDVVAAEVGTPSVAEAAALALAGAEGHLLLEKRKNAHVTIAIAALPRPPEDAATLPGRPRGHLAIVGLGPGAPAQRTIAAREALLSAADWVGYDLYLQLAEDLSGGKRLHPFPLGAEEERVRHAIRLAGEGRRVALLGSGDAAIYAMASLVFELLEREQEGWSDFERRIHIEVIPGITALQAASAAAGALIGHDFCAISLSDLMTPWEVIRRRIETAALGDFVMAFYNPRSRRRTTQLAEALEVLRAHRPPSTPVLFASQMGRPQEKLHLTTLAEARAEMADMLSIVLVGNSESRIITASGQNMAYTPRGYGLKNDRPAAGGGSETNAGDTDA